VPENLNGIEPGIVLLPVLAVFAVLWVAATVSIARRLSLMSAVQSFGWSIFVFFVPLIGPVVWFASGRPGFSLGAEIE
jgi:hypothetical protein